MERKAGVWISRLPAFGALVKSCPAEYSGLRYNKRPLVQSNQIRPVLLLVPLFEQYPPELIPTPVCCCTRGCAVVACTTPDLLLVDPRTPSAVALWQHAVCASAIACVPESALLLAGDERGTLSLYDLRHVGKGHAPLWTHSVLSAELKVTITDLQVAIEKLIRISIFVLLM